MRTLFLTLALLSTTAFADESNKRGFVPDAQTAIAIAVAVWTPIYGEEDINFQKPYVASLSNGIWSVRGTLPKNMLGGVAEADISEENGTILRIEHGE